MTDKEAAELYRTDRTAWLAWKAKQAAEAEGSKTTGLITRLNWSRSSASLCREAAEEIARLRALVIHYADQAGVTADEVRRVHNF